MVSGLSHAIGRLTDYIGRSRDNFDRNVSNELVGFVDVAAEKPFTPERLRYFKDGTRVFLEYGDDATFTNTDQGFLLQPASDQTLTLRTAEKAAYRVGYDLWPTQAFQINGPLQAGDAVGLGYGELAIGDFDPTAVDPEAENPAAGAYTGTDADGYFRYHTTETGLADALLAEIQRGTVLDSRIVGLQKPADVFTISETRLNCYAVGPAVFRQSFTDIVEFPDSPQANRTIGAVANDDGKGAAEFSHRTTYGIKQGAGNSGLEIEAGSVAVRGPADGEPQFKSKGHSMNLDASNPAETYQVAGGLRIDPDRENVKLRVSGLQITNTPGSNVTDTAVLLMAVDSQSTNAPGSGTWSTPIEHNPANSVLQEVEVDQDATTPLTGPVEDDPDTDSTGAVLANAMNDPGGYQLGRGSITTDKKESRSAPGFGNRELYPGDVCLLLVDVSTAGTVEVDVQTLQNS
jgi:hypothetical protein